MRRTILLAALLAAAALPAAGQTVELAANTELSDTGHYRLSWTAPEGVDVTVEEAAAADFSDARTIYEGPDGATVLSGQLDGTYHYRARAGEGPWSDPVAVTVRHHSLAQAFAVLAVGAVVFLSTAGLIIAGHRRHRQTFATREEETA